jgi:hypothetical protein
MSSRFVPLIAVWLLWASVAAAQTIALYTFDEPQGLYPSSVISDLSDNDYPLVLGLGGVIVAGKFGNALQPIEQPRLTIPKTGNGQQEVLFGLISLPALPGRKTPPLSWENANFCALMTAGEAHLRKEVGFANPTQTKLNLGAFDWTIEFWFQFSGNTRADGVVFELGQGPRADNPIMTRLVLEKGLRAFRFLNVPGGISLSIPTSHAALSNSLWHHIAFVYEAASGQMRHYVDGRLQPLPEKAKIKPVPYGEEAYLSLGRDGLWEKPLQGRLDELRFSEGQVYLKDFTPPKSFSPLYNDSYTRDELRQGPPLLFNEQRKEGVPIRLLDRKYLFIDDAIVASMRDIHFTANPPRYVERVMSNIRGTFRKHLTVIEDGAGRIRLYMAVEDDHLAVWLSEDGKHFVAPDLGGNRPGERKNIVLAEPAGTGQVFIDENAPPQERWRYLSGFQGRGIFLYVSPDGFTFTRIKTAVLPFRAGSQSNIFYDDQRQAYLSYHRSDLWATASGETERGFVMAYATDLKRPWPFTPLTQEEQLKRAKVERTHHLLPWYLDNGPLTPGGFGFEYPRIFAPSDTLDPSGTDIYVPKALKYPWAPDVYLAFPAIYFHYEGETHLPRKALTEGPEGFRGGPIESQLAVSRDGLQWKRYPRPAYIPIGKYDGDEIKQIYPAQGLVRRGDEIWQYFFGDELYHSSPGRAKAKRGVYRVVQRLDGFVSADSPYDREAYIITKPFVFEGNRLVLNINTSATGYAQLGFVDADGRPIAGFSLDESLYINTNSTEHEVKWLKRGEDVSPLEGKIVRLEFRMRGTKLYAMQFVKR